MIILSFVSMFNFFCFVLLGIYIVRLNIKETANKLSAMTSFCFAWWSFCCVFLYIAPTAEAAMLWHRLAAIGWGLFTPFAAHYFLLLSERKVSGIRACFLIYFIPALVVINALFNPNGTAVAAGFVQSTNGVGWVFVSNMNSLWYWIYVVHLLIYFVTALSSFYSWAQKSMRRRFVTQAKNVITWDSIIILSGGFWELVLPAFFPNVPPATNLIAFIWGIGFFYIIKSAKLLSPDEAATPELILKTVIDPILFLDGEGVIKNCNEATEDMLKLGRDQILNRSLSEFLKTGEYKPDSIEKFFSGKQLRNEELELVDSRGKNIIALASFSLAENKLDGPVGIVANLHDVTKLKEFEKELEQRDIKNRELLGKLELLANYDALTGLPNRRFLFDKIDTAIAGFSRTGKEFAVIFIDLDGFKRVNDLYGHDVGDKLLQQVAKIFTRSVRKDDIIARVGGDEFVMMVGKDDGNELELLKRLDNMFARPINIDGHVCEIGLSYGISRFPNDTIDKDELVIIADNRMYKQKEKHKLIEKLG